MSLELAVSPVEEACQANFTLPGLPLVTMPVKLSCPATSTAGLATETVAGPMGGSVITTGAPVTPAVALVRLLTATTVSPVLARCTWKVAVPLAFKATGVK